MCIASCHCGLTRYLTIQPGLHNMLPPTQQFQYIIPFPSHTNHNLASYGHQLVCSQQCCHDIVCWATPTTSDCELHQQSEYLGRVNKSFRRRRGTVNLPVVNLSCRVRNILKSQGVAIGFVVIEISCHR